MMNREAELTSLSHRSLIPNSCVEITPEMLPLVSLESEHISTIVQTVPGGSQNVQDIYPLSPLQEGMLFHRLMNEDRDTYVLSTLFQLQARAEVGVLLEALQRVISRHDVLRSAVLWEHLPRPVQVVYRNAILSTQSIELEPEIDAIEALRKRMEPGTQRLNLCRAPMMQLQLAQDPSSGRWYALLHVHHLICDHESMRVAIGEVMSYVSGHEGDLPIPEPFRNHVAHALAHQRLQDGEKFFHAKLSDIDEPTAPFGVLDVHGDRQIVEASQVLELALAKEVRAGARACGISVARLFHAAWALVVARTSGKDDVVFGTVVLAGLQRASRIQGMVGLHVNTLPLRLRLAEAAVAEFVAYVDREISELLHYEHVPLTHAQRCSAIHGTTPLFSSILNYRRSRPESEVVGATAGGVTVLTRGDAKTNYPVTLTVDDLGDGFSLTAQTDHRISADRIIGYLTTALQSLVRALARTPQAPMLTLRILPESERHHILHVLNSKDAHYPREKTITQLFEEQVAKEPDAVAAVYEQESLTYAQLNSHANQLARFLRGRGVGTGQVVAICAARGLEMMIGVLGTLKAGAAYLPLDPNYPPDRLEQMLQDAAPQVVLTQEKLKGSVPSSLASVIALDALLLQLTEWDAENLSVTESGLSALDLVYVIYTSGSTGRPKGTAMAHRAMVNLIEWHRECFRGSGRAKVLQFAALSFDVAFQEIFSTLCMGGTLVLLDEWVRRDARALIALLIDQAVERLFVPPLMLQSLAECFATSREAPPSLVDIVTAGEQLRISPEIVHFLQHIDGCRLHNHYGPTETHVVTALTLTGDPAEWHELPSIGQPIANTKIYILDRQGQPVPLGAVGEIYIAGAGLARGYLNRPELTATRFISDEFGDNWQCRLYKTGDLGRWTVDGTIEYLGRNDDQVKIRGFRVELGEVEAQVARHPCVKEAAVVVRDDVSHEKRLVAYITTRTQRQVSVEDLRAHAKQRLPDYMVPSAFVLLDSLPVTPSGKLNRRALPAPDLSAYVSREYEAPRGEVEEILAGIWRSLLGVDRIGRQDNFFELGGHSLLIVQLKERLRGVGLSTDLRRMFESSNLADLAAALKQDALEQCQVPPNRISAGCAAISPAMLPLIALNQDEIDRVVRSVPGGAANVQDIYPLVPLQEGILFHHLLNERGGDTYLVFIILSVASQWRLQELIEALQAVIDRHDILRTSILWEELPSPVQVVHRQVTLPVEEFTLDPHRDAMEQITDWIKPERQKLDLRRAPMMRLQVAAAPGEGKFAILQLHHMAIDHVAIETIAAEVTTHLEDRAQMLSMSVPYRNHVAQVLAYSRKHDAERFFRRKLGDVEESTAPFGLTNVYGDGTRIAESREAIEATLASRIRAEARRLGVSAATMFHAAWALVIAHTSARDDVVFGTLLLGRLQGSAGAQLVLGMFINTLPLRLKLRDQSARDLVEQAQRELVDLLGHEQASLAVAQRCSGIPSSSPLFTALLNYRHNVVDLETGWSRASGVRMLGLQERTNYPIIVNVDDPGDGFTLTAQTDPRIDARRLVGYLCKAMQSLVDALEQMPHTPVLSLSIVPESERREVIDYFNATRATFPHDRTIHELFEEQAEREPDAVSLTYMERYLTYAELNSRANQLARYLRDRGVGPDKRVAICIDRSAEMVVGLLGILKAGGAYVPLDPNYPAERLKFMLEDAAPLVLLTQEHLRRALPDIPVPVIALDSEWNEIGRNSAENLSASASGESCRDLAYVIYTSGSTGKPKGAMNEHQAVVNRLHWMQTQYRLTACDRVMQKTPFSFDVSVWEFFWPLLNGASLVMARPQGHLDPDYLKALVEEAGITTLHFVPSMLQIFLEHWKPGQCPSLRHVICSGEELSASLQQRFFLCLPNTQLSNLYGPTEAAVDVTYWECQPQDEGSRVPIGRPISNVQIYILDQRAQPVPIGVAGEIYIAGVGVGRGYLNRSDLTGQRFLRDPFSRTEEARMYRTGDLGRWRTDGVIEYLGRNDHQIKIRGFRIELGEIEARIVNHPQVKEAVVIAREEPSGAKRLVAYVLVDKSDMPSVESLRSQLLSSLPEYMVPSAFVSMESWPLSPNGKLDRRALPMPDLEAYVSRQYEPPRGQLENTLAEIWLSVLDVDRIGRQDGFFELGGHSLLAMQVIARLRGAIPIELPIRLLFDFPILKDFAAQIENLRSAWLLSRVAEGDAEVEELLQTLASMSDSQAQQLLRDLNEEAR